MIELQTQQLLELLNKNDTLKIKGFSVSHIPDGRVIIDRAGHVHGIWDYNGEDYVWVSPSSSEPLFRAGDAQAALLYTLVILGRV